MTVEQKIREKTKSLIRKHQQCWTIKIGGATTSCWVIKIKYLAEFQNYVLAVVNEYDGELAELLSKIEPLDHQVSDPQYFHIVLTKTEKQRVAELTKSEDVKK